jgi:predicted nucleotidyltransferase
VLAAHLQVDQAVMSKIETGRRKPSRKQVEKLADYFGADKDKMLIAWLSDRIADDLEGESLAGEALQVAKEKVAYSSFKSTNRQTILAKIESFFDRDNQIQKVWIFGSFARGEEGPDSDKYLMVEENKHLKFSYFDLADVQYRLEKLIQRKVDIGFSETASPHIFKQAVLIYEKP